MGRDWWAALGVGAAAGFVGLAGAVSQGWLLPLDQAVLASVAAQRDCGSLRVAAALSVLGAGEVSLLLTAAGAGICLWRRQPRAAAALFLLYLSIPIELALKHLLAQPLPGQQFPIPAGCEWYHPALSVLTPNSFPSGYAIRVTYFVVLLAAWLAGRGRPTGVKAAVALLAGLVPLLASRLVLSWHWPSDLLAGALLGTALAALTWRVARGATGARYQRPSAATACSA